MLKILLYGNASEREILKGALTKQLEENNISFETHGISDSHVLITNYLISSDYPLIVICLDGNTEYLIKNNSGPLPYIYSGSMSFPPSPEEIDEKLIRNDDLAGLFSLLEYAENTD